jgi:acetolactate synthase I/II/III large subunit
MAQSNEITGGEAMARMLQAFHAGPMFGMGGFQLLAFYDAARRLGIDHHLINDERCGAFAADAYAKVCGRVGLVDATLGPGATNLVTGLVEALNAGSPLVAFVGDSNRAHAWKNMTQEARQTEILRPACKDLLRIEHASRIPELIARAFLIATSGRPGPVVVDVPEDVCHGTIAFEESDYHVDARYESAPAVRCRPAAADIERAAELLARARRPLLMCGGGVHISNAAAEVSAFARENGIPVAHTMTGKGAIACIDPLNAGLFGRYDRIANTLIAEADVLLVAGCKLGEIATKRFTIPPPGKTLIHLDLVAEEFGRTYRPTVALWGDVREGITDLAAALRSDAGRLRALRSDYLQQVPRRMAEWRAGATPRLTSNDTPINVARLLHELNAVMPEAGILVADGGFAAHWAGLLYDTKRPGRGFVPDRGFASIGYGLPGAIGATLAGKGRPVVALTGDGGLNMSLGELETARRMGLSFVVVVFNNAASGYVKALQHIMYGPGAYQSCDLAETNYAELALSFGCIGLRVERPEQLRPALEQAMAHGLANSGTPLLIDVVVTRDAAHMLPAIDNRAVAAKRGDRLA